MLPSFGTSPELLHTLSSFPGPGAAVCLPGGAPLSPLSSALKFPPQTVQFSSVQFSRSVVSNSLRPHGLQRARPPCPSPTPGVYSNSQTGPLLTPGISPPIPGGHHACPYVNTFFSFSFFSQITLSLLFGEILYFLSSFNLIIFKNLFY